MPGNAGRRGKGTRTLLECVANLSEGRDARVLERLAAAAGPVLLDLHADADHHRAVLTMVAEDHQQVEAAARRLAQAAVELVDLRGHRGAHPRLGALDVVPFVHLERDAGGRLVDGDPAVAAAARDRFARWSATTLDLPCFCYGPGSGPPERTLPELRRRAWRDLGPDTGPGEPHPRAGAVCVGARPLLLAYNVWLADPDLALARRLAAELRGPVVRALGLAVGRRVQVSCNLLDPAAVGPADIVDAVAGATGIAGTELVGLAPRRLLDGLPPSRWASLDLDPSRTIEARLGEAGLDGGRFHGAGPRGAAGAQ